MSKVFGKVFEVKCPVVGAVVTLEAKVSELPWQTQGLHFTASGYGSKIPTTYMANYLGRWHRVYCRIYSNSGTLYIMSKGQKLIVNDFDI